MDIDPETGGPVGSFLVACCHPGSSFGEVGLLHDEPRGATLLAASPCEMAVISRDPFQAVLAENMLREVKEQAEFLRHHLTWPTPNAQPYSSSSRVNPSRVYENLANIFKKKTWPRGTVLCSVGRRSSGLDIIFSGSCRVYRP